MTSSADPAMKSADGQQHHRQVELAKHHIEKNEQRGEYNHHELGKELRQWVAHEIGPFARPEEIRFTESLPKTRSGKIMRRLLRELVTTHTVSGDVTTLEDMAVVTRLASQHDED